jgi:hypothetical protein
MHFIACEMLANDREFWVRINRLAPDGNRWTSDLQWHLAKRFVERLFAKYGVIGGTDGLWHGSPVELGRVAA